MPWTPRDAYSHTKKASTPALQQRWASIANNALQSGKDDAAAIRIANAAIATSDKSKVKKRKQ